MTSAVPAGGAAPAETPADYDLAVESRDDGVAHPLWIDTDEIGRQEILAARLSSKELER
jgi:hypothetical protein